MESLASVDNDFSHSDNELNMCTQKPTQKQTIPRVPPPFNRTVLPSKRLGGAFTSYVRRRGEPDGRTANPSDSKVTVDIKTRKSATIARPGGGESDAAFTPSPPVVLQPESQNVALSLAHQTRIRNLYSQNDGKVDSLRPDSSSSASSATDWDNGHATVLRRQAQPQIPPLPPPRTQPLGDHSLYNNLTTTMFENSSDSELEKMEAKLFNNTSTQRSKITYKKTRNPMSTLDRLSVRTEVNPTQNVGLTQNSSRKLVALPNEETIATHEQLLYFSPTDVVPESASSNKSEADNAQQDSSKNCSESKSGPSSLHDTILATQLRHINRELTPTISEVYHERNLGLGLAPPLAKLLLNQNSTAAPQTDNSVLDKITLGILEETEIGNDNMLKGTVCQRCKLDTNVCMCKNLKINKPWLSETANALQQIQSSDLTTADILEREVKNKKVMR